MQEVAKGDNESELAWISNFAWGKFAVTLIQDAAILDSQVRPKGSQFHTHLLHAWRPVDARVFTSTHIKRRGQGNTSFNLKKKYMYKC